MIRFLHCILLVVLLTAPLQGRGRSDDTDQTAPVDRKPGEDRVITLPAAEGTVESIDIDDSTLVLTSENDGSIELPWHLEGDAGKEQIDRADSYSYSHRRRPDGIIKKLLLSEGDEMVLWAGSGLRGKDILSGKLSFTDNGNTLVLNVPGNSWELKSDTGVLVDWGEGKYTAYLSGVVRGRYTDTPDLQFNLILLKK